MPDREKVIKGLECCEKDEDLFICGECPYIEDKFGFECLRKMCRDALALLKEQEADMIALKNAYKELAEKGSVIVRCKDCKNFRSENYVAPCKKVMRSEDADENWFCADGEVKRDG